MVEALLSMSESLDFVMLNTINHTPENTYLYVEITVLHVVLTNFYRRAWRYSTMDVTPKSRLGIHTAITAGMPKFKAETAMIFMEKI